MKTDHRIDVISGIDRENLNRGLVDRARRLESLRTVNRTRGVLLAVAATATLTVALGVAVLLPALHSQPVEPGTETVETEPETMPTNEWNIVDGRLLSCRVYGEEATLPESVTVITATAFADTTLKTLRITPSVEEIEPGALDSLEEVHLTGVSRYYEEFGSVLIDIGSGKAIFVGVEEISSTLVIPEGTTEIKKHQYEGSQYEVILIPDSVTDIGYFAFWQCENLRCVILGDGVTELPWGAFEGCKNLEYVRLPSALEKINLGCFRECQSLRQILLPETLRFIGENAFENSGLTSVSLPASVEEIGNRAFADCVSLTDLQAPYAKFTLGQEAFHGCYRLTRVVFPPDYTGYPENAFDGTPYYDRNGGEWDGDGLYRGTTLLCVREGITGEFTVREGTERIGKYAFSGSSVSAVNMPLSLKRIDDFAFADTKEMTSVRIPMNVEEIGTGVFKNSQKLTEIICAKNNRYHADDGVLYDGTMLVAYPAARPGKVYYSEGNIAAYAFYGAQNLERIVYGIYGYSIGNDAFAECKKLKELVFIGSFVCAASGNEGCHLVDGCPALTSLTFGSYGSSFPFYLFDVPTVTDIYINCSWKQFRQYTNCLEEKPKTLHENFRIPDEWRDPDFYQDQP